MNTLTNGNVPIDIGRIFGQIMVFFALTPWASWGTNSMDSQPWPFLFSGFYIACRLGGMKIPQVYAMILALTIFSTLTAALIAVDSDFRLIRGIVSYLTVPLVLIGFYDFIRRYGIPFGLICGVNVLWLIFGYLELSSPGLVSWASVSRTTAERGVTSLAPEPTFFAVYLIFSSWLILALYDYKPSLWVKILLLVNFISIFLLARSAMGIVYLVPFVFILSLRRFGVLRGISFLIFIGFSGAIVLSYLSSMVFSLFEGTRVERLFLYLSEAGLVSLLSRDASVNVRVEHVILPLHAFIGNNFMPHGFINYGSVRWDLQQIYNGFFWYDRGGDNIMSWTGAVIFEIGFLGIVLIALLLSSAWLRSSYRIAELVLFSVYLIGAIPLTFSVIPMLLAAWRYKRQL